MSLSAEAIDLLSKMLAVEVALQVREGRGEDPMSEAWTELHTLSLQEPQPRQKVCKHCGLPVFWRYVSGDLRDWSHGTGDDEGSQFWSCVLATRDESLPYDQCAEVDE